MTNQTAKSMHKTAMAALVRTNPHTTVRARLGTRMGLHVTERLTTTRLMADAACPEVLHERQSFQVPNFVPEAQFVPNAPFVPTV